MGRHCVGEACCGLLDVAERGLRLQVRLKMGLRDFARYYPEQ